MNPGWIYILTNKSLQSNYLKIGRTENNPTSRALELSSSTGVASQFDVAYSEAVPDCFRAEKLIHEKLNDYRLNNRREFFQVDLHVARNIVHETCESIRNNSHFCQQCDARQAKLELYQAKRDQTFCRIKLKSLERRISFFAFFKNYLSILISALDTLFQGIIPDRHDRKVYAWGLCVPIILAGWLGLIILLPDVAKAITLSVLFISAVVVIGSVHCNSNDDDL